MTIQNCGKDFAAEAAAPAVEATPKGFYIEGTLYVGKPDGAVVPASATEFDAEHWAELYRLRAGAIESTSGRSWQDVAAAERISRLAAEQEARDLVEALSRGYGCELVPADEYMAVTERAAAFLAR